MRSLREMLFFFSQFLLKLSHNCLIRHSVTEFNKSLYYSVMLRIYNSNIRTLKTITTFFSLLTEFGYRHGRGHLLAFLILSYSDKRCTPAVHALLLPLDLQSFTTSQPERNRFECGTSGGKFHSVEHFPSFFIRGFYYLQRSSHIPTSAQIFPTDS